MTFISSKSIKIRLRSEQEKWLSPPKKIQLDAQREDVLAYDIYLEGTLVAFALVRRFEDACFFLWDFAVDMAYQGQGIGQTALNELISLLRQKHGMERMVTTYIWGNETAKRLYEKVGFQETDVVDEPDCHEVNMEMRFDGRK